MKQLLLIQRDLRLAKPYSVGPYNQWNMTEQWIRLSEGCPWQHSYCYEPSEMHLFEIPDIIRTRVKLMDMNLLCKPESLSIIRELGKKRVKGKVVHYELICGIDFRFLTAELAEALKTSRFERLRLAWDGPYTDQLKIHDAIDRLIAVGYLANSLSVFMICNWKISYAENCKKLDLLKVWNVKVNDCWFDNQVSPHIVPIHWTPNHIVEFRKRCRKHNQLVLFRIDPQVEATYR
jgi:hypothetical protein